MDLQPLRDAGTAVQLHLAFAATAIVLGAVVLAAPKGGAAHRGLGRAWAACLTATAASSFAIHSVGLVGPFSPLHGLSVAVLVALCAAFRAVRRGDVAGHARLMRTLYLGSLVGTAAFALLPNRTVSRMVFGTVEGSAWTRHGWLLALAFGIALVFRPAGRARRRAGSRDGEMARRTR